MRLSRLVLVTGLTATATAAVAGPQTFSTARSFAMGNTGVAVAQPASANTSNPAMMALRHHGGADDFGLMIPSVKARLADDAEVLNQVDDIQDTIDRVNQLARSNDIPGVQNAAATLRSQLADLNRDTMRADAGIGLSLAVPSSSLSVGVFADANLRATTRGNISQNDLDLLDNIATDSTEAGTVSDIDKRLTSDGTVIAAAVVEAGISIAHAFALQKDKTLSVGISPKYIQLRTFEYRQTVGDFDDNDFDADENQTEDNSFNLDLGAALSFGKHQRWTAGLAVRNVIPVDLDSVSGRTFELEPKVTTGIARRAESYTVTAEVDLTKTPAFGYDDDTQWLALGAEYDIFRTVQLRGGIRQNLASNDGNEGVEESTQLTFGVGLTPFGTNLGISALVSDSEIGGAVQLGAVF